MFKRKKSQISDDKNNKFMNINILIIKKYKYVNIKKDKYINEK